MNAQNEKMLSDLIGAIKNLGKEKTSSFDSRATITRVEGSTAWVHFDGGEDETPVMLSINAKAGEEVMVRVSGGQAFLIGNSTSPPTDDTRAIQAVASAEVAHQAAEEAIKDAGRAAEAAAEAEQHADEAYTAASTAGESAQSAARSANNALTQLSTVENVVGALNWITEHGTYVLSEDTEMLPGKYYFTRSGSGTDADPYTYALVTDTEGSPSALGYYELGGVDEAIANYVSTHLALTDEGLFLTLDGSGYKLKITNVGIFVVNPDGEEVAKYSTTTVIGNQNGAHLEASSERLSFKAADGNEVAYIAVDPDTNESVFYMTKAIIVQDLFFGNWRWNSRDNGNLALKWIGGT